MLPRRLPPSRLQGCAHHAHSGVALQEPQAGFATFEEMLEASGMLQDKPPLAAGESGHSFYTVQPFQLLRWGGA